MKIDFTTLEIQLELLKSYIEWDYSLQYQLDIDKVLQIIQEVKENENISKEKEAPASH